MTPINLNELRALPVLGMREIFPGDSVADLIVDKLALGGLRFHDGDILVVKHKIVSKAEGRTVVLDTVKPSAAAKRFATKNGVDARVVELALREAKHVLRKKHVLITETPHGFICANSGVDVSNVDGGKSAVLLPADPDRSAAQIHRKLKRRAGLHIPVIIADSFGRAWREGLCDVAIGVAGMKPLHNYRGRRDAYGYEMHATEESVADELASVAGLVCGKDSRVPACIIRGYQYRRGNGKARQMVRPKEKDLFR
ncbi:MAG: coenzyme F420-0:L-glutamate ligase [Candidatus Korobacteraceae bacterium]|jgi:coenzyme F420-0:L-glutamate ligase/coenzyme F420-1:gamma-L-glutamate ligase